MADNYQMKDMSGSAFKNNRRDRDTSPDLTGNALINGKEHWVNMWVKTDRNGNMWVSFNLKEKQPKQQQVRDDRSTGEILDDNIPF